MSESKLRTQSMDFAVSIVNLVKLLKEKRESIISNQIGRNGILARIALSYNVYRRTNFQSIILKMHLTPSDVDCIV